jgi:hypothetical protein
MEKIKFSNEFIVPFDIWFLESTKDFNERKLLLGKTKKNKTVISLIEKRIIDAKIFVDTQSGSRAEKIIRTEKNRILYTRQEAIMSRKGKPYGWTYGENKEIHNNKGEVIAIKQKRCDYYGNSEIIKDVKISSN